MNKKKLKSIIKKIKWKQVFNALILIFTLGMITYFIFSKGGLIDLINSNLDINGWWIMTAVAVHLLNIAIDATIIYLFVKETTPNVTFYNAFVASMVGQFFCAVTPSASGGQPMQIISMSQMGIKGANATSALIQKFLVWQFTLTGYSIVAICARFSFFAGHLNPTMWLLSIIGFLAQVAVIVALLLASFNKKLTGKIVNGIFSFLGKIKVLKNADEKKTSFSTQLETFHESNQELNKNRALVVKVYVLTAVQMTALFLVPYCIGEAFGIHCSPFDMLCAQAYVNMVSSLVPLPGASGAAEFCFSAFFSAYFTPETIKSAILIWRTITYYGTIAISAPFSRMRKKEKVQTADNVQ